MPGLQKNDVLSWAPLAAITSFADGDPDENPWVSGAPPVETIAIAADLKSRALPAVEAWIKEQANARP